MTSQISTPGFLELMKVIANALFMISNFISQCVDKNGDKGQHTKIQKLIRLITSGYIFTNTAEIGNNNIENITEKLYEAKECFEFLQKTLNTTSSSLKDAFLKFSVPQGSKGIIGSSQTSWFSVDLSSEAIVDSSQTSGLLDLNRINIGHRGGVFYAEICIIYYNGANINFDGHEYNLSDQGFGLFNSFYRDERRYLKDTPLLHPNYVRFYPYIIIIEKHMDYIKTLKYWKLYVPGKGRARAYVRAFVVSSVWFEDAMRQMQTESIVLTYTNVFPSDCRMFIQVPIYMYGYIHRKDQLNII